LKHLNYFQVKTKMSSIIIINSSTGEYDWIMPFFKSSGERANIILNEINEANRELIRSDLLNYKHLDLIEPSKIMRGFLGALEKLHRRLPIIKKVCLLFFKLSYKKYDFSNAKFIFKDYSFRDALIYECIEALAISAKKVAFPHAFAIQIPFKGIEDVSHKCDIVLQNTKLCSRFQSHLNLITGMPNEETKDLFDIESKNIIFFTRDDYEHYGTTNQACYKRYSEILFFLAENCFNVFIKHHPRNRLANIKHQDIERDFRNIIYINSNLEINTRSYAFCLTFFSAASLLLTRHNVPAFDVTPYDASLLKESTFHFINPVGDYVTPLQEHGLQTVCNDLKELKNSIFLSDSSRSQQDSFREIFPDNYYKELLSLLKSS